MKVDWAPTPLIAHSGSNTMNFAQVWIDPDRGFAMVLMTNAGDAQALEVLNGIAAKLFAKYSGATPTQASTP